MDYKLILENWRKFNEQAIATPGAGGVVSNLSSAVIMDQCKTIWSQKRAAYCFKNSFMGLPSIVDLVKSISKDKDILSVLNLINNKDFMILRHVAKADNEKDAEWFNTVIADASSETDKDSKDYGTRIVRINWEQMHRQGANYANKICNQIATWHDEFVETYKKNDYSAWVWQNGLIDAKKIDNFIRFYGFFMLAECATTLVHELAHVFDPNNIWNHVGAGAEERWAALDDDYDTAADKALRAIADAFKMVRGGTIQYKKMMKNLSKLKARPDKMGKALSAAGELYAMNKENDFVSDFLSSSLVQSIPDSKASVGPVRKKAGKLNTTTWLSPIPSPESPKGGEVQPKKIEKKEFEDGVDWYDRMMVILDKHIKAELKKLYRTMEPGSYGHNCTLKMGPLLDGGEGLAPVGTGQDPDRFKLDSPEDRKTITKFRRSSELNERKIVIKVKTKDA